MAHAIFATIAVFVTFIVLVLAVKVITWIFRAFKILIWDTVCFFFKKLKEGICWMFSVKPEEVKQSKISKWFNNFLGKAHEKGGSIFKEYKEYRENREIARNRI